MYFQQHSVHELLAQEHRSQHPSVQQPFVYDDRTETLHVQLPLGHEAAAAPHTIACPWQEPMPSQQVTINPYSVAWWFPPQHISWHPSK